jgi:hypothetical protein
MEPESPTCFVEPISPLELAPSTNNLIVDCRSQPFFDQGHVQNAIALSFPAILWRRILKQKSRPGCLNDFLMCETQELKRRSEPGMTVIIYDEDTFHVNDCPAGAPLRVLCEIMLLETSTRLYFIPGS